MLVRLVVTGDLERSALGPSIARAFAAMSPHLTISVAHKLNELTTTRLPDPTNPEIRTPTPVTKMANALVTEALQRVRDRCSFHLFVPLVEAYFFGERAALTRAGIPEATTICRRGDDVEDFETDDPEFLPRCAALNAEKASQGVGWWREERHPKRYIDFLVERAGGAYSERAGARALETLDWPTAGALPAATRFARSLFEDLANLLETANPLGPGDTHEGTYPAKRIRREERVLRNL